MWQGCRCALLNNFLCHCMKKQKSEVRHLTYKADEQEKYVLECHGISKAFGGTQALCNVELLVRQGEVHAVPVPFPPHQQHKL